MQPTLLATMTTRDSTRALRRRRTGRRRRVRHRAHGGRGADQRAAAVHAGAVHVSADGRARRRRGARRRGSALASQILYLALGIAGLPVFAASPLLPQGAARLLGPTGGYLMSYPLAAFVAGCARRARVRSPLSHRGPRDGLRARGRFSPAASSGSRSRPRPARGFSAALAAGFFPFIVADLLKLLRRRRR